MAAGRKREASFRPRMNEEARHARSNPGVGIDMSALWARQTRNHAHRFRLIVRAVNVSLMTPYCSINKREIGYIRRVIPSAARNPQDPSLRSG